MMTMTRRLRGLVLAIASSAVAIACPALAAEKVMIPTRVIYPGEQIDATSLKELTLIEGKQAPDDMAVTLEALEGKIAKRTLLPGRYVPIKALRESFLIEKGAAVEMIFVAGSLTISAGAVTLEPGAAGDLVKVRNVDSGKILSGTVMADGTIRIGG